MHRPTALLLGVDGTITEIDLEPADASTSTLAIMRGALGCAFVDVVRLTTELDMWIDDEGVYHHPVNIVATLLARRYGRIHQPYWGPALITGCDDDGNTINLTRDQIIATLHALGDVAETL